MRRRALMDLIFGGGEDMVKYGYFEVETEKTSETWQVNTDDYTIEVQTGLNATPKKIVCVYIDDKENMSTLNAASIFVGIINGNAAASVTTNSFALSESTSFVSPDATYLRFDELTKKIYMHVPIWRNIKCGKWMWIAIYDE